MLKLFLHFLLFSSTFFAYSEEWVNWAGNQLYQPESILRPLSLDELRTCIIDARELGYTISIIGAGHSRSRLHDAHCLISLRRLNRVLLVNRIAKQITCEAGIIVNDLNKHLAAHGLALANQAAIGEITLGGALATATHGTGFTGSLSSFITEITLVTADGLIHTLSPSTTPDEFAAAQVSLGGLGVIYSVTLQCVPLFSVDFQEEIISLGQVIANYKELKDAHNYFQFIWNSTNNTVITNRWNIISSTPIAKFVTGELCYSALCWFKMDESKDLASEIAIPVDALPKALEKTKQVIDQYKQEAPEIKFVCVRFVKKDSALLSPSFDRDVAYISITSPVDGQYLPFFQALEEALYEFGGRPHWGKINFLTAEKIAELYGENFKKYLKVKEALDPERIFAADYFAQLQQ